MVLLPSLCKKTKILLSLYQNVRCQAHCDLHMECLLTVWNTALCNTPRLHRIQLALQRTCSYLIPARHFLPCNKVIHCTSITKDSFAFNNLQLLFLCSVAYSLIVILQARSHLELIQNVTLCAALFETTH
jgi:hypothetical protein